MMMTGERFGVIVKGVGGLYYAKDEQDTISILHAKGIFRRNHITPVVGDKIRFTPGDGQEQGWIDEVMPRANELIRPPVANIGHLIYVLAPEPEPDMMLLDTMLVMAREQQIAPVVVINKCELSPTLGDDIRKEYAFANVPVLDVSAKCGLGLPALEAVLRDGICCFAGQSGVGKSSLLNAITGLTLKSGEISQKIARGKNTTRHAELLTKNGFQVLDTAGFSLLELWDHLEPVLLKSYYPEFVPYESDCRFQPCYHLSEPGCAVLAAMREGKLPTARIARYHELLTKVKESWRTRYE